MIGFVSFVGCVPDLFTIRKMMLRESIESCASQYARNEGDIIRFEAGLDGTKIVGKAELGRHWTGITTDEGFREHLEGQGISVVKFQETVTECQNSSLERQGYYDMIKGTANSRSYGYQYGYQYGYEYEVQSPDGGDR